MCFSFLNGRALLGSCLQLRLLEGEWQVGGNPFGKPKTVYQYQSLLNALMFLSALSAYYAERWELKWEGCNEAGRLLPMGIGVI
jgi:hypothetical protein